VILDIDVGNTRVKWRAAPGGAVQSAARADAAAELARALSARPTRVRVASVAGSDFNERLRVALEDAFGVAPEFAVTSAFVGRVRCGYERPETMGVDRWLGLLAAWQRAGGPLIVVSAGTALTLDVVGEDGRHLGGFIVPGLRLMQESLGTGTAEVQVQQALETGATAPGRSTREAVQHGLVRMQVSFVDGAMGEFTNVWQVRPHLFICGGDAAILAPHLASPHVVAADLVLDGLAVALP
jgi:type III pantothenate kinase